MEGTELRAKKGRHTTSDEVVSDPTPPVPAPAPPPEPERRESGTGMLLGELLVDQQLIGPSQLAEALLQQSASGKRLGALLVELGADRRLRPRPRAVDPPERPVRRPAPRHPRRRGDRARSPRRSRAPIEAIPMEITDDGPRGRDGGPARCGFHREIRDAAGMTVIPMIAPPSDIRRATDKSYKALASVGRHVDAFLATEALTARDLDEEATAGHGAGRAGREPDRHPGRARPRLRRPHRAAGRRACASASASTARCTTCSRCPADMAPGARQPHQDHGRHEHRRAAAPAGRPVRDRRRRPRARHPRRDHADDLGREDVLRLLDKNRSLFRLARARHAGRRRTNASRDSIRLAVRHGDLRRPDRQRQDHHALRDARPRSTTPSATS